MGRQTGIQNKLFYTAISLDCRIRKDHILRKIDQYIDFDFIYHEVKASYGDNGNVSVPPPVILKMMLLLVFYNVRSERELMDTIPERLDWLWFLGYDLDDDIPNHSVLSKARNRWGTQAFKAFFERIVWQCVEAGLVDGSKLFMDSSMVEADASNNSVVNTTKLKRYLNKSYKVLEARLEEENKALPSDKNIVKGGDVNKKHISTTDPDASVVRRGHGRSKLQYQVHRGVDGKNEIITATEVTPGEVHESHRMDALLDQHHQNTGKSADTVVADKKYGTVDNYLSCYGRGINSHFQSLEFTTRGTGRQKGIFSKEDFAFDPESNTFICPAGKTLALRKYNKKRSHYEYICPKSICNKCHLKAQCTRSKTGRTLKRHIRQDDLDLMLNQANSKQSIKDIKTRQHLMERSFANAERYGFKQARWRRLWRVRIQEYLTAAIQNIKTLISKKHKTRNGIALEVKATSINSCRLIKQTCNRPFGLFNKTLITFRSQFYLQIMARFCRLGEIF
jgi:transposase